jgi:hypothetical protein
MFHMCIVSAVHRVDSTRLFLQSSELDPPPSTSPAGECARSLLVPGGTHSLAGEGVGEGPNSDEGTDTVVLYVYIFTLGCGGEFTSFTQIVVLYKQSTIFVEFTTF